MNLPRCLVAILKSAWAVGIADLISGAYWHPTDLGALPPDPREYLRPKRLGFGYLAFVGIQ